MMKCSMDKNKGDEAAVGPVVSVGGRSPSTLTTDQGAPPAGGGTTLGLRWSPSVGQLDGLDKLGPGFR